MQFTSQEVMNILEDSAHRARCEEALAKALSAFLSEDASQQEALKEDGYAHESFLDLASYAQEIAGYSLPELEDAIAELKEQALGLNGWMFLPSDCEMYRARIAIAQACMSKLTEK